MKKEAVLEKFQTALPRRFEVVETGRQHSLWLCYRFG